MPEHYIDWWWEDLPEKQKKYARMLGYENQKHWDDDEAVPYDSKDFDECTYKELKAARYLGLDPIDQKLDIWWSEASEETKKHAGVLGWDQEKWDDDWMIEDLPCEHLYWKDLSEEQKAAAKHFGYNKALWDETEDEEDDEEADEEVTPPPPPKKPLTKQELDAKKNKPSKPKFGTSEKFGGSGGKEFQHGNHRTINKLTVRHDGHAIHCIEIEYFNHKKFSEGKPEGTAATMELEGGDYIVEVKVRANKLVQSLEFTSKSGKTLKAGGMGDKKDKPGVLTVVKAPPGCQLCGLEGRAGSMIDQIAFKWGPAPRGRK